jgi:plastocyanin
MASIAAAAVAVPTFTGLKAETRASPAVVSTSTVVRMAPVRASATSSESLKQFVGKALFAASGSLLLAASANAATVKMGGDDGSLGFFPSSVNVAAGEAITFINNKGFPHNVVFDEDAVPSGVKVDEINHEEYLNAPDEKFDIKLTKAGTYEFYCEPHQGAGMKGTITVS